MLLHWDFPVIGHVLYRTRSFSFLVVSMQLLLSLIEYAASGSLGRLFPNRGCFQVVSVGVSSVLLSLVSLNDTPQLRCIELLQIG